MKSYSYVKLIIQNLLYNGNQVFDEKLYFFVVRCFEIEKTNYRSACFVGGQVGGEGRGGQIELTFGLQFSLILW